MKISYGSVLSKKEIEKWYKENIKSIYSLNIIMLPKHRETGKRLLVIDAAFNDNKDRLKTVRHILNEPNFKFIKANVG